MRCHVRLFWGVVHPIMRIGGRTHGIWCEYGEQGELQTGWIYVLLFPIPEHTATCIIAIPVLSVPGTNAFIACRQIIPVNSKQNASKRIP